MSLKFASCTQLFFMWKLYLNIKLNGACQNKILYLIECTSIEIYN